MLWILNNFSWFCFSGESTLNAEPSSRRDFCQCLLHRLKITRIHLRLKWNPLQLDPTFGHFSQELKEHRNCLAHVLITQISASTVPRGFTMEIYTHTRAPTCACTLRVANRLKKVNRAHCGTGHLFCGTVHGVSFVWLAGGPLWDRDYHLHRPGAALCHSDASGGLVLWFVPLL